MTREGQPALVFSSQDHGIIPWTLLGFCVLSAAVHLFGFYIFQTVYPAAAHVSPPPVQVSLLTPGTPENDALLRWVASHDPSLIAQPRKAEVPALLDLPYLPSYATVHARPSVAEPAPAPLPFPSGAGGLDLVRMALPSPARPDSHVEMDATVVSLSGGLSGQIADGAPVASLHSTQPGDLMPARFMLGVSNEGDVRYVFLQDSSGDKILDADAGRMLEQTKFPKSGAPLTWGFATVSWGAAVFAHPSPSPAPGPQP